jgi:hypothetical protein
MENMKGNPRALKHFVLKGKRKILLRMRCVYLLGICNFMRAFLIPLLLLFFSTTAFAQLTDCPKVQLAVSLLKEKFSRNEDIVLTMTLTNNTDSVQSVWFDKHKVSTGGPAWTSVSLINKKNGKSVLKYENKAILSSQAYSLEEVEQMSTHLNPTEKVFSKFSLYDLVVLKKYAHNFRKGSYEMQVFYCTNPSNKISFTID